MTTQHQLMRVLTRLLVFAVLTPVCSAGAAAGELVRAVRESENWIHNVDSFELQVKSIWTTPPQPAQSETENTSASSRIGRPYKSGTKDFVEFAFNSKRVRYRAGGDGTYRILRIWDGEKAISHEQSPKTNKEDYYISAETGRLFETMFASISWLRSQPHSFWFCPKNVNERMKYYGYPEDFVFESRRNFRGVDCYVLDWKPAKGLYAASDLSRRWYVGTKDKHLYGLATLRGDQTDTEHYTLDYREIAPGCWFPMKQGYKLYEPDSEGKYCFKTRRDMEMVKVRINEKLPDEMFQIELKEGVEVTDDRSGQRISYIYKAPLVGKVFPSLKGISIDFDRKKASDNLMLFCFFDIEQRPSRNCLRRLNKTSSDLKAENVVVLAVHASKIEQEKLDDWIKENDINLTVGSIAGEEEQIRLSWGVKSLPWLILTDSNHVVTAEGFGLEELDKKVPAGPWPVPDAKSVMEKMRSFDEAFLQPHTLVVRMRTAADAYNQYERGQKLTKITLTSSEDAIAVEREISYTDVPAYRKKTPVTDIDYRPDGSLIVWRRTRERSLMESDFQGHQSERVCLLVSPEGQITELEGHPSFDFYRPSDMQRYVRWFHAPLWATGRGFADSLTSVTEVHQTRDGLVGFTAAGFLDPRIRGTWQMVVDPKADYLVRSACFTATGSDTPSFECTTSGTKWFDACCLAEGANIGRLRDNVVIEQYKPEPDKVLLDEFRRIVRGPLPEGVTVYDWRPNPRTVVPYIVRQGTMSEQDVMDETIDIIADIGSAPSLVGKSLPEFEALGVKLQAAEAGDRKMLVCFFDMNQRPSRHLMSELARRAEEFKGKGVIVAAVQASKVDEAALNEWIKKNNIPFPVGTFRDNEEKRRFNWGVKSLPWLILTDHSHVIHAEGFGFNSLDNMIEEMNNVAQ